MRTFAQKSKALQQTTSAKSALLSRAPSRQSGAVSYILQLQRTIGNQRVQRLLRGLQAARDAAANPGAGHPLSQSDRAVMSARFGYDFGSVRIHTRSEAAGDVGAKGFVSGEHIWFGPGHGPGDRELLSHELAHVVQQATGEAHSLGDASGELPRRDWLEQRARTASVQRPSDNGRLAPLRPSPPSPAVIQFDFEEDTLRELHRLPAIEEKGISARERRRRTRVLAARVERLYGLFSALTGAEADEIYERLRVRRKGDILSELFHDMLSTETRNGLLASIGLKEYTASQIVPNPADFCRPFSKREIDQDIDFVTANDMEHFVNDEMRAIWGDEVADLYDKYLTSTSKNETPKIFDDPNSKLVQSFVNHAATTVRQLELAAIIEANLYSGNCKLPPNEWVDRSAFFQISPKELKADFSFGGVDTIPAIVAGGVSPGAGVPESRSVWIKRLELHRTESNGGTTGVKMRVQFGFQVEDAIDFCPGNMGGFLARYVTIPLSRLEASGMAFAVPFQVHYDGPVLEFDLRRDAVKACSGTK